MVRWPFDRSPATPSQEQQLPPFAPHHPAVLRVHRRAAGTRTTLSVAGEVDLASVGVLRAAISAALQSSSGDLWIDLHETAFMDTAGVHLLVETHHEVLRRHRRLAIVCPRGTVRRVIEITGLAEVLPVHDDTASAARCASVA
jgi:anti-sigma B factor antagonist